MGYLFCKKCGGYYELQPGEFPKNFHLCQCGGELVYKKNLDDKTDGFNVPDEERSSWIKLPSNSNMIKTLGIGLVFIFGLLLKFHVFNFVIYYFMRSNSNFLFSSPMYVIGLIALGFILSYLSRFVRS